MTIIVLLFIRWPSARYWGHNEEPSHWFPPSGSLWSFNHSCISHPLHATPFPCHHGHSNKQDQCSSCPRRLLSISDLQHIQPLPSLPSPGDRSTRSFRCSRCWVCDSEGHTMSVYGTFSLWRTSFAVEEFVLQHKENEAYN